MYHLVRIMEVMQGEVQQQQNVNATRSLRAQMPSSEVREEPSTFGPGHSLGRGDNEGCDLQRK